MKTEAEYHEKARRFSRSLVDHEKGKIACFVGWGFIDGRLVPDYDEELSRHETWGEADMAARQYRKELRKLVAVVEL